MQRNYTGKTQFRHVRVGDTICKAIPGRLPQPIGTVVAIDGDRMTLDRPWRGNTLIKRQTFDRLTFRKQKGEN